MTPLSGVTLRAAPAPHGGFQSGLGLITLPLLGSGNPLRLRRHSSLWSQWLYCFPREKGKYIRKSRNVRESFRNHFENSFFWMGVS